MKKRLFILLIFFLSHPLHVRASHKYFCITNETQIYNQPNEQGTPIKLANPGEIFVYLGDARSEAIMSYKWFATVIRNNRNVYIPFDDGTVIADPDRCNAVNKGIEEINKRREEMMQEEEKERAAEEKQPGVSLAPGHP
jgi:hypothetical protein